MSELLVDLQFVVVQVASVLLFGNLALLLSLTSFHHFWRWFSFCSLSSGVASSSTTLWLFTAPEFSSSTSDATTRFAPLRDHRFAVGARAPQHRSLQQRGLLFVRSGFTPSSLWDSLSLRFVEGLQHHCVIPLPRRDPLVRPTPLSGHRSSCLSLYRLTSLTEIFASCAARCARCYVSLSCHIQTLLPFTCADDSSLSLSCLHAGVHTSLKFAVQSFFLDEASCECLHSCSCFFFCDLASYLVVSGHASTQTCVH